MQTFKTDDTLTDQERELAALVLREYADGMEKMRDRVGGPLPISTGAWELRSIAHKIEWGS
jgi:hypothetical protein